MPSLPLEAALQSQNKSLERAVGEPERAPTQAQDGSVKRNMPRDPTTHAQEVGQVKVKGNESLPGSNGIDRMGQSDNQLTQHIDNTALQSTSNHSVTTVVTKQQNASVAEGEPAKGHTVISGYNVHHTKPLAKKHKVIHTLTTEEEKEREENIRQRYSQALVRQRELEKRLSLVSCRLRVQQQQHLKASLQHQVIGYHKLHTRPPSQPQEEDTVSEKEKVPQEPSLTLDNNHLPTPSQPIDTSNQSPVATVTASTSTPTTTTQPPTLLTKNDWCIEEAPHSHYSKAESSSLVTDHNGLDESQKHTEEKPIKGLVTKTTKDHNRSMEGLLSRARRNARRINGACQWLSRKDDSGATESSSGESGDDVDPHSETGKQ
eukprot:Ihof_evm13s56 gene=Ihof_evmTU13s56